MSGRIARMVVQSFHGWGRLACDSGNLSWREEQILDCVAQGHTNKEIANALGIGSETVHSYLKSIYEKLHVHSRVRAVVKYLRREDAV
jgi:DNA-binding NarL/FixJ family response regulator